MGGRIDVTNQEVKNLKRQVIDLEGKLVKLAALEAAFDHFTNEHWLPLHSVVISLHDSLCWTCTGNGEPIPDGLRSASAPPSLSIAIPIPPPRTGRRPATPGPPPCQGHSCPITSTERLYTVQVSTTRQLAKIKDSNNYLGTNV